MNQKNYAVMGAGVVAGGALLAVAVYRAGKILGCFGGRCEFIDGETGETYYGDRKKMSAMLRRIYRESAEMLTRTYTPEFKKIIDQTIIEVDAAEYETRKEYLAFVYEKAKDACWAFVGKLLEQTEGEDWTESIATGKMKAMVSRTVEELLGSWSYRNRMYEIYQENEKEKGDAA